MASAPASAIEALLQQARAGRQRALLVLAGTPGWCRSTAQTLTGSTAGAAWIGEDGMPAGQARQLLGSECPLAVFDAHSGLHPDALAAVAGTVVAGGALLLLVPPLDHWPQTADPDYARLASYPHDWHRLPQRFIAHLRHSLLLAASAPGVLLLQQGCAACIPASLQWPALPLLAADSRPSAAQQQCLQQLAGHSGVSVLLAGRGHGKSALLGFAARQWQQQGKQVLLVAPSRRSVASVFRHAGGELAFSAPDMLLQDPSVTADVLLIDEAAAIPLPLLFDLLRRFPQALLATTTDGYEGTGQGFVLRCLRELDREFPTWQRLDLPAPVRWADGDPLEAWLYRALLLDAQEPVLPTAAAAGPHPETLTQQQLLDDPVLLRDVYGLLRSAHYRTTPDDLRFLLDAPQLSLYRLASAGQTIAVALVVEEGSLDGAMAAEIAAGKRRPRGHLLVQTLAIHEQQPQYLQQRVARVVRIAVHTQLQGRGLGSQLLQAIIADQHQRGVDAIGSSFSATPEVLAFWLRNGFKLMRIGHKRQAASAAPSAVVLRPC